MLQHFGIEDVYGLLEQRLPLRHKRPNSYDVDCPFCEQEGHGKGRGKLNLYFPKGSYHCNRCDAHGGKLALYIALREMDGVRLTNQEAYAEICEKLHLLSDMPAHRPVTKREPKPAPVNSDLAPSEMIHRTLSLLLELLPLTGMHGDKLRARGLSDGDMEQYRFRSTPVFGFASLASKLLDMGCCLKGVPGFYVDQNGEWSVNFRPKFPGIIVPVVSAQGLVCGFQIRLDRPIEKMKYMWFSSADLPMGVTSGSPVHCAGTPFPKTVYLTEGALKADVAHALSGKTFYALAGVNQYGNLPALFQMLKEHGVEDIYEAYDADKNTNRHVRKGMLRLWETAREAGYDCNHLHSLEWNPAYKGIDDWLFAQSGKGGRQDVQVQRTDNRTDSGSAGRTLRAMG